MAMLRSVPNLATRTPLLRDPHTQIETVSVIGQESNRPAPLPLEGRPLHLLTAGFEALDLVNVGLLVTSASGQLLLANRTAEEILKLRDGIELGPTGLVRTSLKCTPSLSSLIDAAIKADGGLRDSVVPVRRPSGKRPLTAVARGVEGAVA